MSRHLPARLGLFRRWHDAYHEALFRADITGRRYRVWYEPNNQWWNVTELTARHRAPGVPEETS